MSEKAGKESQYSLVPPSSTKAGVWGMTIDLLLIYAKHLKEKCKIKEKLKYTKYKLETNKNKKIKEIFSYKKKLLVLKLANFTFARISIQTPKTMESSTMALKTCC